MPEKKNIDFKQLKELCGIMCTGEECAGFFNIDYDTLNARIKEKYGYGFSEYFKRKCTAGKISLRRTQFRLATEGDKTLNVWLGKQWLGQTDNIVHETAPQAIKIVEEHVGEVEEDYGMDKESWAD